MGAKFGDNKIKEQLFNLLRGGYEQFNPLAIKRDRSL